LIILALLRALVTESFLILPDALDPFFFSSIVISSYQNMTQ